MVHREKEQLYSLVTYEFLACRTSHSEFVCHTSSEGLKCFQDILRSWYLIKVENKLLTHAVG